MANIVVVVVVSVVIVELRPKNIINLFPKLGNPLWASCRPLTSYCNQIVYHYIKFNLHKYTNIDTGWMFIPLYNQRNCLLHSMLKQLTGSHCLNSKTALFSAINAFVQFTLLCISMRWIIWFHSHENRALPMYTELEHVWPFYQLQDKILFNIWHWTLQR